MSDEKKLSPVEAIKAQSNYLRGALAEELANDSPAFTKDSAQLIKHHGMYQQDDRDQRASKAEAGKKSERQTSLMVRVKLPGGRLSSRQLLAQLDIGDQLGNSTIRLTDRQAIQLHGVLKQNVRETIRRIDRAQMTTLGACGDVERNVLCCPAPLRHDSIREQMQATAARLSTLLLPRSKAYHEIWVSDETTDGFQRVEEPAEEVEPIYGKTYLPRKFKTALSLPDDNCIDVHANDLGFLAICDGGNLLGYNVLVGGGMGVTPSNKNTFPAVAKPLTYVAPEEVDDIAVAVVKVYRDFGDRGDRKRARLKYLIADWGMDRFKAKVEEYFGRPLAEPKPVAVSDVDDHLGWRQQGDGRWFYGLNVENGRVLDRDGFQLKSALREICGTLSPGIRLTAQQNILFTDLADGSQPALEEILSRHGVKLSSAISNTRRWSMACVALPTCPLAVTESERVMPQLVDRLEAEVARLGLTGERFTTHMTGCPNGCARPYNADIGINGKTAGKYTLYLGGRTLGDRLGFIYEEIVALDQIVPTLVPVLACFARQRNPGETLGDFCHRLGPEKLKAAVQELG